jgi:hypothetical protein
MLAATLSTTSSGDSDLYIRGSIASGARGRPWPREWVSPTSFVTGWSAKRGRHPEAMLPLMN